MNYILFTTTSCPKCPEVKECIAHFSNLKGKCVDNTFPDFLDLAEKYRITHVPTVVFFEQGLEVFRATEQYEIQQYLSI